MPYGAARLPQGNALQIEVEKSMAEVKAEKGKVSIVPDLFWSKDVMLFEGEGTGSRLDDPLRRAGGRRLRALRAAGARARTTASTRCCSTGSRPSRPVLEHEPGADVRPQTQFDGYALETYVGADYQVGWPRLTKGRHTLTFVCLGKSEASSGYNLGVDDIVLAKTGTAAWAAAAKVQEPRQPVGQRRGARARRCRTPIPVTRGLAAMALRQARVRRRQPALPALTAALKDPDPNVRLMSGNAIAAIGKGAAPAVPALIAACSVKDEQIHVLRACAAALGAIGKPAATPALPLLKELAKMPRVRWAAERAIKNIE